MAAQIVDLPTPPLEDANATIMKEPYKDGCLGK